MLGTEIIIRYAGPVRTVFAKKNKNYINANIIVIKFKNKWIKYFFFFVFIPPPPPPLVKRIIVIIFYRPRPPSPPSVTVVFPRGGNGERADIFVKDTGNIKQYTGRG